jgi:carboxyl-terminal processing protease
LAGDDLSFERQRTKDILNVVAKDVEDNFYDPGLKGVDWKTAKARALAQINAAQSSGEMMTAIFALIFQLQDSHTTFVPPSIVSKPYFGFEALAYGNEVRINHIKTDGPAARAGLQLGDRILSVNGFAADRTSLRYMMLFFRALQPVGVMEIEYQRNGGPLQRTTVKANVKQRGKLVDFFAQGGFEIWDLVREFDNYEKVNHYTSVDYPGNITYVRMPSFTGGSEDYFRGIIKEVRKAKAIILDLRANPGGYVDAVSFLAGFFQDDTKPVANMIGRKKTEPIKVKSQSPVLNAPMYILVDSGSASASEIFSRHFQRKKRAFVIGDKTSGSVTAARYFDEHVGADKAVFFGSSIAVARVQFDDGEELEKKGVTPDHLCVPSESDLRSNRDPCLNAALTLARAQLQLEPLPEQARPKVLEDEY